jgi:predicted phosphoribosyltransferase
MKFRDFTDAGEQLAPLLADWLTAESVLIAIAPGGVPVAKAAQATGLLPDLPLHVFVTELPPNIAGLTVVAIDDGVETGTAARAVGALLREAGVATSVLAVPVCPRESEPGLRDLFDDVIAIDRPFVRRALHWHYENFQ